MQAEYELAGDGKCKRPGTDRVPEKEERSRMPAIYTYVESALLRLRRGEEGQALVEYALILGLISVVSIGALTLLGGNINAILDNIAGKV